MGIKSKEKDYPEDFQTQQLLRGDKISGFCASGSLGLPNQFELCMWPRAEVGKIPLDWTPQMKKTFSEIKVALVNTPNLALSDVAKFFHLFVDEKMEEVKGVLMKTLGPWKRLTANLSKKAGPSGYWLAFFPPHNCSNCFTS